MKAQPENLDIPTLFRAAQIKRRLILSGFVLYQVVVAALLYFVLLPSFLSLLQIDVEFIRRLVLGLYLVFVAVKAVLIARERNPERVVNELLTRDSGQNRYLAHRREASSASKHADDQSDTSVNNAAAGDPPDIRMPLEVINDLRRDREIVATRRLRTAWGMDMKDAEEAIAAYQAKDMTRLAELRALGSKQTGPAYLELPQETVDFLRVGERIKALQSLYKQWGIGNLEGNDVLSAYQKEIKLRQVPVAAKAGISDIKEVYAPWRVKYALWKPFAILLATGWALITSIDAARDLNVLVHADDYVHEHFQVKNLHFSIYRKSISWHIEGMVRNQREIWAPLEAAEVRRLGETNLRRRYPVGAVTDVWYNPAMSDQPMQLPNLRLRPYVPDLRAFEIDRIVWWLTRCLLPFALVLGLARYDSVLNQRRDADLLR